MCFECVELRMPQHSTVPAVPADSDDDYLGTAVGEAMVLEDPLSKSTFYFSGHGFS
jgi:hypothetical protein